MKNKVRRNYQANTYDNNNGTIGIKLVFNRSSNHS